MSGPTLLTLVTLLMTGVLTAFDCWDDHIMVFFVGSSPTAMFDIQGLPTRSNQPSLRGSLSWGVVILLEINK